jgi:hypothetical protein
LQLTGVPGWQPFSASHVSAPLQYEPSSHAASLGVCTHWSLTSSQLSVVQATPSLQLTGVPGWQPFSASHVSAPLQYEPSSHAASLGVCTHSPSTQLSVVQALLSLQFAALQQITTRVSSTHVGTLTGFGPLLACTSATWSA